MSSARDASPHYRQMWPEQAEAYERREERDGVVLGVPGTPLTITRKDHRVPPWHELLAEGVRARAVFMDAPDAFASIYDLRGVGRTFGTYRPPPPDAFTITNVQHFQYLPAVERIKRAAIKLALTVAAYHRQPALMFSAQFMRTNTLSTDAARALVPDDEAERIETVVRAEQAHMLYHKAMWRAHGRRVVVLDPTTYTLLANTDLPAWPCALLASPWPAFYIQLPPRMFEFEVQDVRQGSIDKRFAEGVCVAMDHAEPEHDGPRELAFMVMGEDEGQGPDGRNAAFATIRFGGDATLDQFTSMGSIEATHPVQQRAGLVYGDGLLVGTKDLTVHIPRVVVGLMLYLASEHPDIVPVPPVERRTFADVRSPKQRETALARQADRLKHATRLPVLVIGSRIEQRARAYAAKLDEAGRTRKPLDRTVHVRGHWHKYRHGPGRALTKVNWIKPYEYGPDMAESMIVRAARVPRAQANPNASETTT